MEMPKFPPQRSESLHFHGYYFKVSDHVISNALALVLLMSSSCFLNLEVSASNSTLHPFTRDIPPEQFISCIQKSGFGGKSTAWSLKRSE